MSFQITLMMDGVFILLLYAVTDTKSNFSREK
jgi:hypothetical protein